MDQKQEPEMWASIQIKIDKKYLKNCRFRSKNETACKICRSTAGEMESMACSKSNRKLLRKIYQCKYRDLYIYYFNL